MQNNILANLSVQQLKRAVAIREEIDALGKELDRLTGDRSTTAKTAGPTKQGKLSAAARARISAAMKARWAKRKRARRVPFKSPESLQVVRAKNPSRPGQLKERIVRTLKASGKSGVRVKDLAAKLGTSYGNVSVWFHTTAKGVKEIKKVEPGRFAWAA